MAIAFNSAQTATPVNPGTSLSWSHNCGGSNRLLIVVTNGGVGEGDKVTGATYGGVSMTLVTTVIEPGDSIYVKMWYMLNPPSGSNTIAVSLTSGYLAGWSSSYTGVKQVGALEASDTNTQLDNASITTSLTTISDRSWTILGTSTRVNPTAGTGSTKRSAGIFDSGTYISPPQLNSMTIGGGDGGTDWGTIITSFAPATAKSSPMFFSGGFALN